jgi:hypothetical protein
VKSKRFRWESYKKISKLIKEKVKVIKLSTNTTKLSSNIKKHKKTDNNYYRNHIYYKFSLKRNKIKFSNFIEITICIQKNLI